MKHDDDEITLDLGDDDEILLDLDDDELSLDPEDDEELSLDKLDLARAYIDMGDGDGARSVLEGVLQDGSESERQEANQLLEKID